MHKSIRFHHKVLGGAAWENERYKSFLYATSRTRSAKADSPVRDLQIYELELICNLRVADSCRLQRGNVVTNIGVNSLSIPQ